MALVWFGIARIIPVTTKVCQPQVSTIPNFKLLLLCYFFVLVFCVCYFLRFSNYGNNLTSALQRSDLGSIQICLRPNKLWEISQIIDCLNTQCIPNSMLFLDVSQRGFNFLPSTPFHRSAQLAPSRSIIQSTIPVLYLSSNPTTYFHLLTSSTLSSLFSQVKLTIKVFYSNNILFKFASKDQKRSSQDGEWQLLNWWWFSKYMFFSDTLYMVTILYITKRATFHHHRYPT